MVGDCTFSFSIIKQENRKKNKPKDREDIKE